MDSITQAVLGASVGAAAAGHKLGRRATWWGALGGLIPDFDSFVAAPFGEFARLAIHRGSSHSLWFGPVVGSALGYAVWRFWYARRDPYGAGRRELLPYFIAVLVLSIFTHPLLDVFTSYGTQLLAPFSRHRFVFEGVGIVDPFYTGTLIAGLAYAYRKRREPERARRGTWVALTLSTLYLFAGVGLNQRAAALAKQQLEASGATNPDVTAYSTIMQIGLRRVVARTDNRLYVGYVSSLFSSPIHFWQFELGDDPAIDALRRTREGRLFEWFALGRTAGHVRTAGDVQIVEIDDVRYGLPGTPGYGFWGIRGRYDPRTGEVSDVHRLRREMGSLRERFLDLFPAALGHDPRSYLVGVGNNLSLSPDLPRPPPHARQPRRRPSSNAL